MGTGFAVRAAALTGGMLGQTVSVGRVGAENTVMSCDLHVLVYETAEPVSSQRPDGRCGGRGSSVGGRLLSE